MKNSNLYFPIDKDIIQTEIVFDFDLFIPINANTAMECIQKSQSVVTPADCEKILKYNALYVHESEYSKYEHHYENVFAVPDVHITPPNFAERSAQIYDTASMILSDLFSNPESVKNYVASKEVVDNILEVILDDDFSIKALLDIATQDYYTHTHSINVAIYALSLGRHLKLSRVELSELGEAALLHDLGKSRIDPTIINKKGSLTKTEFKEIQKHPMYGFAIALRLGIKNKKILYGIRQHHEKIDGSGYPFGFKGSQIPLYARIIGLCDIFDAVTSQRSYKDALSSFEAFLLIKKEMKGHVDPVLLDNMIGMFQ